ncbi:MAG: hypothetical protein HC835_13060 [Oscillatoriales cyanobacterium RM2_1_1]|nr:hypothetical protein [Oscillatoriales cyanobacterium SM2_3_0]NJO46478.1 hypothetical protein [Oscillatoriales cyanobacterium RM2_1_1]
MYFDFPGTSPTLTDLGQAWKTLLQNSQSTLFGKLTEVLTTLSEGEIQTVDQLHQELAIALEQVSPTLDSNPSLETDSLEPRASQNLADQVADLRAAETQISSLVNLESAGRTDVGQKRNQNEDFFSVQTFLNYQQTPRGQVLEATGIYILCDGMGGHAGGEVASQLAVDTLRQYFQSQWVGELPTEATLQDAILQANGVIYEFNQRDVRAGSGRMGTTLALLIVANNRVRSPMLEIVESIGLRPRLGLSK